MAMRAPPCSASPTPVPTAAALSALLACCASLIAALHTRLLRTSRLFRPAFLANCLAAASSAVAQLRHAPTANRFLHNILLAALLKSRDLPAARGLFGGMPHRDTIAYNSMIAGYVDRGRADEVFQLIRTMRKPGVKRSCFTFSIV